jgi:hypothetical protein
VRLRKADLRLYTQRETPPNLKYSTERLTSEKLDAKWLLENRK